jgi:hypothetical protein
MFASPQTSAGDDVPAPTLGRRGVDLTAVSAERKRQEPSMAIFVAIRATAVSGSQTLAGRRIHA